MADYGIKIAKSSASQGINSTNINDYIFWSKYETLSLYQKFTTSITLTSGNYYTSLTIYHNLGYYPVVWVFARDCNNKYVRLPYFNYYCTDCDDKTTIPYLEFNYEISNVSVILKLTAKCCLDLSCSSFNTIGVNITFNPVDIFVFREKIK